MTTKQNKFRKTNEEQDEYVFHRSHNFNKVKNEVKPGDKPPAFGAYRNEPLTTMSNKTFHKQIQPEKGKFSIYHRN